VYGDGLFRHLQVVSRREEVLLAQLRSGCSLLLGKTQKRVQGADSICPHCGEEDLEHVLKACPEWESPRRRNFMQVPPTVLVYGDRSGRNGAVLPEVFDWDLP
jgi:hypothetical protein